MAITLNASTSSGLVQTADTSGIIQLQSNGSTKATIGPSGFSYPGAVLQVVQAVKTDTYATSPGALWADISGLSVSITPTSSANKILVLVDVKCAGGAGYSIVRARLLRNSTPIYVGDAAGSRPQSMGQFYIGAAGDNIHYVAQIGGNFLDSPATTSAITYKVQIGGDGNSTIVFVNRTQGDRDNTNYDSRVASSITVMEIAA